MQKDLGTWNTITEVMDPLYGFAIASDDCINTHVINELEIPIVVMGAHDMIVAAGPDGILVADKEQSSSIRPHKSEKSPFDISPPKCYNKYNIPARPGRDDQKQTADIFRRTKALQMRCAPKNSAFLFSVTFCKEKQ